MIAFSLGGCADPLSLAAPTADIYRVSPDLPNAHQDSERIDRQILVQVPAAAAALDTTRIAISGGDTRLDYIAGAAWNDRAPKILQSLMIQALESHNSLNGVARDAGGVRADLVLKSSLYAFQAAYPETDFSGQPSIAIDFSVQLISMPERNIIASRRFTRTEPVASRDLDALVMAYNTAMTSMLDDFVTWTLTTAKQAL